MNTASSPELDSKAALKAGRCLMGVLVAGCGPPEAQH